MKTTWHAKNHHLIATRGGLSVSVEVPIDGYFTDAREWLRWLRACILRAEASLAIEEWMARV